MTKKDNALALAEVVRMEHTLALKIQEENEKLAPKDVSSHYVTHYVCFYPGEIADDFDILELPGPVPYHLGQPIIQLTPELKAEYDKLLEAQQDLMKKTAPQPQKP